MAAEDSMDSPDSYVHRSLRLAGSVPAATPVNWRLPRNCGHSSDAASRSGARMSNSGRIAAQAAPVLLTGERPKLVAVHDEQDAIGRHRSGIHGAAHVHFANQLFLFGGFQYDDVAILVADVHLAVDDHRRTPHGRQH